MKDIKKDLLIKIMELSITEEDINTISTAIDLVLKDYNIEEKSTELTVPFYNNNMLHLKNFLGVKRLEGRTPATLKHYSYILTTFLIELNMDVKEISTNDIRFYLAKKQTSGLSNVTLNNMRSIYNSFFKYLMQEEVLEKNPIDKIPRFKCQKKHMPAFTNLEMEKLFDNCTSTRDRALLEFLYSTGCRVQECVNMDIDDIDFKAQTCLIRQGKGNKDRLVYVSDKCMYWLEKYLKERKDNDKALWFGKRGRLSKRGIEVLIKRIGDRAGVHAYPHKFRHTLATNMVRRGAPLPAVQQILGHENIGTTMVYVDVNKQTAENAHRQSVT